MSLQLFDLSGKTALVTGSSRGLGNAIAGGLGAAGATVVLNGVDGKRLNAAAGAIRHSARVYYSKAADGPSIIGNLGDSQPGCHQCFCRTAGAQQAVTHAVESVCEFDDAGFIRHAD